MVNSRTVRRATRSGRPAARVRGFTLAEVLVTVVIVGTALVVLAQGSALGLKSGAVSERHTTASLLAEDVAARLETGEVSLTEDSAGDFGDQTPGYAYSVALAAQADPPDLVHATITISWGVDEASVAPSGTFSLDRWVYHPPPPADQAGVTKGPNLGNSGRGSSK